MFKSLIVRGGTVVEFVARPEREAEVLDLMKTAFTAPLVWRTAGRQGSLPSMAVAVAHLLTGGFGK